MASEPTDDVTEAVRELIPQLTFANVYPLNFHAERKSGSDADSFHVRIEPKFVVQVDRIDYLFKATCRAFDQEDGDVAEIDTSLVASFDAQEGLDPEAVPQQVVERFGYMVGLFSVFPYIREAIQSHGSRLGLPNLTMDLLRQDQPLPDGVSLGPDEGVRVD